MTPTGSNEPKRWKKIGVRSVARTRIFEVQGVEYQHPQHATPREFSVINAPDWVNVVALTPAHELVLVRQFRYGTDDFSLEIPGGMIEPGEDPLAAGLRELQEETGFTGGRARLLGGVHPNPAMQNNRCHFVLAEGVVRTAALAWDENEEMAITTRPVDEVYALAFAGGITHALVLDALLFFSPVWAKIKQGGAV
jgi:8-oxo-dGTP pyrophosphatase MutT (NUDIX family)